MTSWQALQKCECRLCFTARELAEQLQKVLVSAVAALHTIYSHKQKLLRFYYMKQFVQVGKDFRNHFCFRQSLPRGVAVSTVVNDPIHVKV